MSLEDWLDVPEAKSFCSTSAMRNPRIAASRAIPCAENAAADDQQVEGAFGKRCQLALHETLRCAVQQV